jgi:hypothetical protein
MHRLFVPIGVTGPCVVTQAAVQPVRLICKSIDRSERLRSRWFAVGPIAGLMALAIGTSAAVARPRSCYGDFVATSNACGNNFNCTVQASAVYYQCMSGWGADGGGGGGSKGKGGSGGSKTKGGPGKSKHDGPVNASAPNMNPGVLKPNLGGSTGAANRPPVAQSTTGGGLGNATTGAILTPTGPGQGSAVGGTVGAGSVTAVTTNPALQPMGGALGVTRPGLGAGPITGGGRKLQ